MLTALFGFASVVSSRFVSGVDMEESARLIEERVAAGLWKRAPKITAEQAASLPTDFDSATNWPECSKIINDIRDQSNCGCCWAFGAAEAASDRICIATGGQTIVPLSSNSLCFCASSNGCNGGTLVVPWEYIQFNGLVTGAGQGNGTFDAAGFCDNFGQPNSVNNMPHCHHHGPQDHTCTINGQTVVLDDPYPAEGTSGCPSQRSNSCPSQCDSSATSPNNVYSQDKYSFKGGITVQPNDADTIAYEIMTNGPVEAAFTVYSDFEDYTCGIYQKSSNKAEGGHAIKIVGWGVDNGVSYWKVANSWNPTWGEEGYFRILKGKNECGIESQVTSNSDNSKWVGPNGQPLTGPKQQFKVLKGKFGQ